MQAARRPLGSREPQLSDLGRGHRAARVALSCLGVSQLLVLRDACGSHSLGRRHTQDGHLCLQLRSRTGKPARALGRVATASRSGGVPAESSKLGQGTGACACLPAAALAALGLTWGRKESVVIGYPAAFQWSDWKANVPLWLHRGLCVC